MSFYDVVMLLVLGGAVWFGFWKGLAWQIASLAAVVVSYIVAVNFREPVSHFIQADEPWNRIGAMLVLFLGTSIVIWIIYGRVKGTIKQMELKGFDRQAGALVGAVKGALLCMVVTMFAVSLLGQKAQEAIDNSKLGRYVVTGISKVSAIVPTEIANYVQPHIDHFNNKMGQPVQLDPNANFPSNIVGGGGSQYQVNGNQQNPNGLPPAQSGYQGQWQLQTPQPQPRTQPAYGTYGQPQGSQPNNWNQGYTNQVPTNTQGGTYYGNGGYTNQAQQPATQPSNSPFNGASQELFSGARQVIGDAVGEAAKRAFESGAQR